MTTKFNAAGHGYDTYDSTKQQFAAVANRHGIQWSWEYPGIFVFTMDGVEWATGPNGWDYATRWDGSGESMRIGDESDSLVTLLAKFDAMLGGDPALGGVRVLVHLNIPTTCVDEAAAVVQVTALLADAGLADYIAADPEPVA